MSEVGPGYWEEKMPHLFLVFLHISAGQFLILELIIKANFYRVPTMGLTLS